jgi:tRNA modification GTPase
VSGPVSDTIAAIATPPGRGGVGIVRLSGPHAPAIGNAITGCEPAPRHAHFVPFRDRSGELIDQGLIIHFVAPHSFTGEDVIELHGHGGPVVMDMLLECCVQHGARLARAGEFSERAFLNGRLDLAQAEAIADLIDSESSAAARLAMRSLQGEFSQRVHRLVESLTGLRMYVEAAIDFPEEEIDFLSDGKVAAELQQVIEQVSELLRAAKVGRVMRDGMKLVIAGLPNAGKSSLLNALAGTDSAIVTEVPGTTRDLLREHIQIDGMPLHLVDTAGLREADDAVERIGIERARREIEQADRILWVYDGAADPAHAAFDPTHLPTNVPVTFVHNKADRSGEGCRIEHQDDLTTVYLSARDGDGLPLLREHLKQSMGLSATGEGEFIARRRHLAAIEKASAHLAAGKAAMEGAMAGELLAEDLRLAQLALAEITGEFTADDLLGEIFAGFCIGK